jgi:hypothetical protein
MDADDIPPVLRAFPTIKTIFFVWSTEAYCWMCTQAMTQGPWCKLSATGKGAVVALDEFPQRSADNAWAVFCPSAGGGGGKKPGSYVSSSLATRLLGQGASAPWIIINMTVYGNMSLAEWGTGGHLDFFTTVYAATAERGSPALVSLNTPPSVLEQLYGDYTEPPRSISWLSCAAAGSNGGGALPEFTRTYFSSCVEEDAWWARVIKHTAVNLHVLPPGFDPDAHTPPAQMWKK